LKVDLLLYGFKGTFMSYYTYISKQKVEFYDCDPMGVVWHGNYLKYLEKARGEFLSLVGYSYYAISEDNYFFPIVEERLKYTSSLKLLDEFEIRLNLDEFENRLVHTFEIVKDGIVCVKGKSIQVALVQGSQELSFFMPKGFVQKIESFLNKVS
jgi:acyl-CoA thioester hydrolase